MQTKRFDRTMHLLKLYCLPLLVIAFMVIMVMPAAIKPQTAPIQQGVLDLNNWSLTDDNRLPLNGEWAFYWNQFSSSSDLRTNPVQPDLYAMVPNVWNSYRIDGQKLPAFGFATYRLQVTGADPRQSLMFYLDSVSTAYALYINDVWMAGNGTVARSADGFVPYNQPRLVAFHPPADSFDIIIHVSNYTYARGGIWYQINLGTEQSIRDQYARILYKDALLLGCLIIMALYHLNYFILLREFINGIAILLLDLVMMIRIALYGDYLILRIFPDLPYDQMVRLNYLTLYWAPILFFFMVVSLYFHDQKKMIIKRLMFLYGIGMSVLTLTLPLNWVTSWVYLAEVVLGIIFVLALAKIVQAWRLKMHGADLILLTCLAVFFLILHDVLYQMNLVVNDYGELTPLGLCVLLFMMSILTSGRFLEQYHERRVLMQQLDQARQIEQRLKSQVQYFHDLRTLDARVTQKRTNVCIISDDDAFYAILVDVVDKAGCQVLGHPKDVDFHHRLSEIRPADLVLIDVRAGMASGFDLLRQIRQLYTPVELPVLLMIDRENHEEAATGFWLGANDVISRPFNQAELLVRVNNLIQMQDWIEKNVNSELAFLQAQIKPHFIFNTLSVIASQCQRQPDQAKELLLDLSDYLRESFDFESSDGLISITRELNLVKAYLSIERVRFSDRLDVAYEIDDQVDCLVPLLSIQPLVENAVQHGVLPRAEGGRIHVQVKRLTDTVSITINDTGVGMTQQQIDQIFHVRSGETGIGLRNVHHRLLNLYGKGLQISSTAGAGTRVSFDIPLTQR